MAYLAIRMTPRSSLLFPNRFGEGICQHVVSWQPVNLHVEQSSTMAHNGNIDLGAAIKAS